MAEWRPRVNNGYRPPSYRSEAGRREITLLVVMGACSILLWGSPYGGYLLYPFSILATWFHEMGHGLAALAFGYDFERLVIFQNGSGYALYTTMDSPSRLSQAMIAGAGLIGPTLAGCLLILASARRAATRSALVILGLVLIGSTLIWVRSMTGWIVLPLLGVASLAIAFKGREQWRRFAVQFLGVQGCISIYRDFGYLFSEGFVRGGQAQLSDTGVISQALFLPYWFWGGLITAMICAMVFWSLRRAHS
ncbi:M50 family metallopeptidase [Qipengyuania aquimaris]|uniref:M50 family metallopeptidase n=1 Tax=Qipengyuania aquimaris TaxID=255984 RepID=A0A9Q3XD44_9SPHN|nr:M50 family metallopeptidase [Qipengyuania aquimaris]MBY6217480.1 M50 family metallopeptidase [Qipengyuania aquimaris]